MNGWVKLHRKIIESPIYSDSQAVHLWIHLLARANHQDKKIIHNGKLTTIKRGQMLTGRKVLAHETGIGESKVQRLLNIFVELGMIEQQTATKNRYISIANYDTYQESEQQANSTRTAEEQRTNNTGTTSEQQVNKTRTVGEQQVNTNKNVKNVKNVKKRARGTTAFAKPTPDEIIGYIAEKNYSVDPERFFNHYQSNGWKVGKNAMKCWKSAVSNWNASDKNFSHSPCSTQPQDNENSTAWVGEMRKDPFAQHIFEEPPTC